MFTTAPDGTIVKENIPFASKGMVYLDGGPGPNAPQTTTGLDDGPYVFQVTDPLGKFLLSRDPSKCRLVEVRGGVIQKLIKPSELGNYGYPSLTNTYQNNSTTHFQQERRPRRPHRLTQITTSACHIQDNPDGIAGRSGRHDTNHDAGHWPPALVVQLMPYGTTPDLGGVYKAWMTPLAQYLENGGLLDASPWPLKDRNAPPCPDFCAAADPGFLRGNLKTDSYKVRFWRMTFVTPQIFVRNFFDRNANGIQDADEEDVTGWQISIAEPNGTVSSPLWTPVDYLAAVVPGIYTITEITPAGTTQTASYVDGSQQSLTPYANPVVSVSVRGTSGEQHSVVYGNVRLGQITACKVYDRNGNGVADTGEPTVAGWRMELSGTLANGSGYDRTQDTGADGCTSFTDLPPGTYTVTELSPGTGGWSTVGVTSQTDAVDGASQDLSARSISFANFCTGQANFGITGYWHNKNGLSELTPADVAYVNGLTPYARPSSYFQDGDEPFDGRLADGTPVAAVRSGSGGEIAPAGSWQAEVSSFLVDSNAGSDPREKLAQQLLAFIFNVQHRLDDPDSAIPVNGAWVPAASLVNAAVQAWQSAQTDDDRYWEPVLTGLNSSNPVTFIRSTACGVVYP